MEVNLIPKNELAVNNWEDAIAVAKVLIKNNNAVLITEEENLFILNWVWCESAQSDRNEVVFMPRYDFEENFTTVCSEEDEKE